VLWDMCTDLRKAIMDIKRNVGIVVEVVITGDFNRYN
jgi:hypothetical protein